MLLGLLIYLPLVALLIACWGALHFERRAAPTPLTLSARRDMDAPHEPGLGRLIRECEARGLFANTDREGRWWWWEQEFGTRYDVPPIGSFGPFASIELALRDALRREVQS